MNNWISEVCFRHLIRNDLPELEWEGEYTHFRRLFKRAYRSARRGNAVLWVAVFPPSGKLIGQLFVRLQSSIPQVADGKTRAFMYAFRVRPKFRNAGLGSKILYVAEQDLRKRGFRWVSLNVNRDNSGALRFYERHGYHIIAPEAGRWSYRDHKGQLRQVHEPAWRMEKEIGRVNAS